MEKKPHIFAFYSFKGGVGRSMALLNVAHSLVARGRDVLLVDLDLEAPGITSFLEQNLEIEHTSPSDCLDLLDWAANAVPQPGETATYSPPQMTNYISRIKEEKLLLSALPSKARLDIIGASLKDSSYLLRLNKLALANKSKEQLINMSRAIRSAVSSATVPVVVPDYFPASVSRDKCYDYVLIDSRTGFTEIGGLCVGPLADQVLAFTALNSQNIYGTRKFLERVGLLPEKSAESCDQPTQAKRSHRKRCFVVASPVPQGDIQFRETRFSEIKDQLGKIDATLSYHPQMALMETNFIREFPTERLADEYNLLATLMMKSVHDDIDSIESDLRNIQAVKQQQSLEERDQALREGKIQFVPSTERYMPLVKHISPSLTAPSPSAVTYDEAMQQILRLFAEAPSRAELLLDSIIRLLPEQSVNDYATADRLYAALTKSSTFQKWTLWTNWGMCLRNCAMMMRNSSERWLAASLLKAAVEKLNSAEASATRDFELAMLLPNFASIAREYTKELPVSVANDFVAQQNAKLTKTMQITKSDLIAREIGHLYRDLAERNLDGPTADDLFTRSYSAYEAAESHNTHNESSTPWSWARALQFHARKKLGQEMHNRFEMAYAKFGEASLRDFLNAQITAQWGEALYEEADRTVSEDPVRAREILAKAKEKLTAAPAAEAKYPEIKAVVKAASVLERQFEEQTTAANKSATP